MYEQNQAFQPIGTSTTVMAATPQILAAYGHMQRVGQKSDTFQQPVHQHNAI